MSMSDPISDMLTRIRNALAVDKKTVTLPSSKMKVAITKVLEEEGYIKGWEVKDVDGKPCLTIELKYYQGKPVIEMLQRVSKPSLRKYSSVSDLPSIWDGLGVAIVSTSKGVVTAKTAKKLGYGGEVICYVA